MPFEALQRRRVQGQSALRARQCTATRTAPARPRFRSTVPASGRTPGGSARGGHRKRIRGNVGGGIEPSFVRRGPNSAAGAACRTVPPYNGLRGRRASRRATGRRARRYSIKQYPEGKGEVQPGGQIPSRPPPRGALYSLPPLPHPPQAVFARFARWQKPSVRQIGKTVRPWPAGLPASAGGYVSSTGTSTLLRRRKSICSRRIGGNGRAFAPFRHPIGLIIPSPRRQSEMRMRRALLGTALLAGVCGGVTGCARWPPPKRPSTPPRWRWTPFPPRSAPSPTWRS